jgi:septum formation protein
MQIAPETPLVLGSASPRRRAILSTLRVPIRVVSAGIDEQVGATEDVEQFLERVVRQKLRAVEPLAAEAPLAGVLVADTIVVVDRQILGKPDSPEHALELLRRLSGRTHTVHTRYAIAHAGAPEPAVERTVVSRVTMRTARGDELDRYVRTGEGLDKAGAYAVQGIGSFLVERIEGSYTNVVGLPACEVIVDLQSAGLLADYP